MSFTFEDIIEIRELVINSKTKNYYLDFSYKDGVLIKPKDIL